MSCFDSLRPVALRSSDYFYHFAYQKNFSSEKKKTKDFFPHGSLRCCDFKMKKKSFFHIKHVPYQIQQTTLSYYFMKEVLHIFQQRPIMDQSTKNPKYKIFFVNKTTKQQNKNPTYKFGRSITTSATFIPICSAKENYKAKKCTDYCPLK